MYCSLESTTSTSCTKGLSRCVSSTGAPLWHLDWADRSIVDGAVRLVDQFGRNVGRGIAQAQTGQVQGYGMAVSVGVLAILGAYLLFK